MRRSRYGVEDASGNRNTWKHLQYGDEPAVVISTVVDVDGILGRKWQPPRRVIILSAAVTAAERATTEKHLNRLASECGCRLGAMAFSVALLFLTTFASFTSDGWFSLRALGKSFLFSLAAGVVAKLVAIYWARRRYRSGLHVLRSLCSRGI